MPKLTDDDYNTLESFLAKAIQRAASGQVSVAEAVGDIMHPLTAWDDAGQLTALTETIPWMRLMLKEWDNPNA
jgi:hypothetical protein